MMKKSLVFVVVVCLALTVAAKRQPFEDFNRYTIARLFVEMPCRECYTRLTNGKCVRNWSKRCNPKRPVVQHPQWIQDGIDMKIWVSLLDVLPCRECYVRTTNGKCEWNWANSCNPRTQDIA
ncbi:hypothetical protein Hamer_G020864 [Homarus americanus]|uniref:Uncharacterized protein n=1 Tax=Homarus americanus TaxID=6706 RepID=A0A8J5JS83_HOMAM|nr:hypothetical protein Hamer_G020864 [Homarus americanus]